MNLPFSLSRPTIAAVATLAAALQLLAASAAEAQTVQTFASALGGVRGLQWDASGRLYATLRSTGKIVRFSPPDSVPTTFASGIYDPIEMVFDDAGNMFVTDYVADNVGGDVLKITPGGVKSTFVSLPSPDPIARDAAGNLYVGEYFNQRIIKVTPAGVKSNYGPVIGAAGARLTMLQMDTDGTLYAGLLDGNIYAVSPGGATVTPFNHSMASALGFVHGDGGDWFASSYDDEEIWRITPAGAGTLYAGAHLAHGYVNGSLLSARFHYASGLAYDGLTLYIADYFNSAIRMITIQATPTRTRTWGGIKASYR